MSKYISELGTEGRLIQMQVEELISNVARDEERTIMDYENWGRKPAEFLQRSQNILPYFELHQKAIEECGSTNDIPLLPKFKDGLKRMRDQIYSEFHWI